MLRCTLYMARRNTFGCKKDDCDCGKHLTLPAYESPDATMFSRVKFLGRLEALVAVGVRFHLNDLDRDTWDELIALKRARHWIDEQVDAQRERIRQVTELEKNALDVARKEAGIPPPGQSLFGKR